MPAHGQDDANNARITQVGLAPAVYTSTTEGTGRDMSYCTGPICATINIGVVHADTTVVISFTQSATVGGTYSAISGAPTETIVGTQDGTVEVTNPFEFALPFVKCTATISGGTQSAGLSVTMAGAKVSY